jgi:hypothetical protein
VKFRATIALLAAAAALAPAAAHRPWGVRPARDGRSVRGALHVHGPFSEDARAGVDRIAREARQAGLDFVVITDHGHDRVEPGYREGVLVLAGMEKSTDAGHALVLGASPLAWRLDGEPETIVQDADAQGGFVVAAHPASSRAGSRWTAGCAGLGGLEILNLADPGAWRRGPRLWAAALRYPADPGGALLSGLRPSREPLEMWDRCLAERDVAGWLGSDAHGGFEVRPFFVPVPSYRAVFRVGSNHLLLDEARNGDAAHDAGLVWRALRGGRGSVVLDGLAEASRFRFEIGSDGRRAGPGETLPLANGAAARLLAHVDGPPGTELVLVRDGTPVLRGASLAQGVGRGVYRVEAYLDPRFVPGPGRPPWILSNAIAVVPEAEAQARHRPPAPVVPAPPAVLEVQRFEAAALGPHWQVERAPDAASSVRLEDETVRWDFRLGTAGRTHASLTDYRARDLSGASGLAFRVRASSRFRFDVQVRVRDGDRIRIWRRSLLAGPDWRPAFLPFAALRTYDGRGGRPALDRVIGVYFAVEAAHLARGTAATLWIDDLGLVP